MKDNGVRLRPFSIIFTVLAVWVLSEMKLGLYIGLVVAIVFVVGLTVLQKEKRDYFPMVIIVNNIIIQIYAFLSAQYLFWMGIDKSFSQGFGSHIGASVLLMTIIVIMPFFSTFPVVQMSQINKKYLFLILPSMIISSYWFFFLFTLR